MRIQLALMLTALLVTASTAGAETIGVPRARFVRETYGSIPGGVRFVPQAYGTIPSGVTFVGETYGRPWLANGTALVANTLSKEAK
jgi:hypothetical protein